jgi:recombination protein RecA
MSSFPLFSPEEACRPVAAALKSPALVFERLAALPRPVEVTPASRLTLRLAPEMVSSGVSEIDALTGGFPRGCLSEICGPVSSGRTSLLLAALAAATRRQEACALVDVSDALDPASAVKAGVNFKTFLWVRCGVHDQGQFAWKERDFRRANKASCKTSASAPGNKKVETPVEQALRVADLLLQSGGFGMVVMDLGGVPWETARRIPLTSWFRFQRAVEHTPTVLFVITPAPCAQTCAALVMKMKSSLARKPSAFNSQFAVDTLLPHAPLLDELHIEGELLRSRLERKPMQSVTTRFVTRAVRMG